MKSKISSGRVWAFSTVTFFILASSHNVDASMKPISATSVEDSRPGDLVRVEPPTPLRAIQVVDLRPEANEKPIPKRNRKNPRLVAAVAPRKTNPAEGVLQKRLSQLETEVSELRKQALVPSQVRSQERPKLREKPLQIATSDGFDSVPIQSRDSIIRRLKLVELILRKEGKAYDYRNHTTRELEQLAGIAANAEVLESRRAPEIQVIQRPQKQEQPEAMMSPAPDFETEALAGASNDESNSSELLPPVPKPFNEKPTPETEM